MKRKVSNPDIWSNFKWHSKYFYFRNNLYFNTHIFSNFNFFFFLILFSLVLGFFVTPDFWALTLSLMSYMMYAWFRTKKLAYGLHVKRLVPLKGREKEEFEIHYDFSNETGFSLPAFSFRQNFDGVQEGSFEVKLSQAIPPQTRVRLTLKLPLDAGMGIKTIGDFTIPVGDELSLFSYQVDFVGTSEVEVYPLIIETPQLKKSISPDSVDFGFYDIQKRGDSNLFIGTREYRHGDAIKHINWKLSRKTKKLIVNEFEKNTNTYVTLLLDLELHSQVGFGAMSSWEAAKDLALSIAVNEIKHRNYVQVLSQDLFIPFGTGESQLVTIKRHFTFHELSHSGQDHLRYLSALPSNSQIYFLCPLLATNNVQETLGTLKRLRQNGHHVTVFGLDPYQEMRKAVKNDSHMPVVITGQEAIKQFELIREDLRKCGISFVTIDVKERVSLRDMMTERARHLLEEGKQ